MKETEYQKLPTRLEAWDADDNPNGWALEVQEVLAWAKDVLIEGENNPSLLVGRIKKLIEHLSD